MGTGSSLLLLPLLVQFYGPKAAAPIMAIAAISGNASRMMVWWRSISWRPALIYASAGIPGAALGAHTLLALPSWLVDTALGVFFWAMVPLRARLRKNAWRLSNLQLWLCGAVIGFLTGLVVSTGPLSVPAFSAYGLTAGAFLGTEAASALLLYGSKIATFAGQDALSRQIIQLGIFVGVGIMAGTVASKAFIMNISPNASALLIDGVLLVSGSLLISHLFS